MWFTAQRTGRISSFPKWRSGCTRSWQRLLGNITFLAAGGMPNHSHLLLLLPPVMSLSIAINKLKANSSRFMRRQGIDFNWQKGYGAFSVSSSQLEKVKAYIRNQREHDKKRTFEQEFLLLLKKAGIAYDPKYVFG
jgi:REP-associated tyrosine transposase